MRVCKCITLAVACQVALTLASVPITAQDKPNVIAVTSNETGWSDFSIDQANASSVDFTTLGSMAQLAYGGSWTTTFTLMNSSSVAVLARLNFFSNAGNPLPVPIVYPQLFANVAPQLVTTLIRTVLPGAGLVIQTAGSASNPTLEGWAQLLANGKLGAFAVVEQANGASTQEALVPLEDRNPAAFEIWFDNTGGNATGIAVVNINPQTALVPIVIRDELGVMLQSTQIIMTPQGHTSFDLANRYLVTSGRRGTVEIVTPGGGQISVLGIHVNPTGGFSTVPALTK